MLLLALALPPLALYLLALGWVNRRTRPLMAAGTWDFVGVLFALSGFLLFGGPALLGGLDEQARLYWLLGQSGAAPAGGRLAWLIMRLLYFAAVAGVSALVLWRSRRLTSVYNVDPHSVFPALEQALRLLGLNARRAGDAFVIEAKTAPTAATAVHIDLFPLMRHATLRWEPADPALRRDVERGLAQALAEAAPPDADSVLGAALSLVGISLFILALVAAGFLLLLRFYPPR